MHRTATPILLFGLIWSGQAQANAFCLAINRVAIGGGLQSYSNEQVESSVCTATREAANARARQDRFGERACLEATRYMIAEFTRRFPGRDPTTTVGRC